MHRIDVPGYDVWGLLGEGGMSDVWLAKHRTLHVPVIVKTLKASVREAHGEAAATHILHEARLMARVSSPNIVRALDAGTTANDGSPFLVQEYVDGLDLAELDRRRRSAIGVGLPLWVVCHVMHEVSRGLRAAHQAGVIHRDLKPSNVFGAPETGIRLGDFGIAVARSDNSHDGAGTLKFMAPEQFSGADVGRFTDVWGAGATACDLRYGRAPFDSVAEIIDPRQAPRLPAPTSPAEAYFQQILRAMLAKDLNERPEDLSAPVHHFAMLGRALSPPPMLASRVDTHSLMLGRIKVSFVVGDIAQAKSDAIVSSANFEMKMRTGVGEALRARGGDAIEAEAMAGGERPLGSCVRTSPGSLATKHVFHAVSAWNEVSCVGRAFSRALLLCDEHGCCTVAVPALGTGQARVSLESSANSMTAALRWHAMLGGMRTREITVYLDSEQKRRIFQDVAEEVLGLGDGGRLRGVDLGLPVEGTPCTAEAATYLDASGTIPPADTGASVEL
ncbi:serine/threonine-protein kinase [Labilithrix luteola]|nr:serine/threonine-protein kinase [Labilithrix luteola]